MHNAARINWLNLAFVFGLVICGLVMPDPAQSAQVRLPITLDYPLLQSLVIREAYRDPGTTARILDLDDGCNTVILSHPRITHDRGAVRFATRVSLEAGTPVGGYCVAPLAWQGIVVLWQRPEVDANWQLHFSPTDSRLLDLEGRPVRIASLLWDLVKTHVHAYLSHITIDLAPPVGDLKSFLLPLFDADHRAGARRMLDSMRPSPVRIQPAALQIDILAKVPDPPPQDAAAASEPLPPPENLARVMALWETWDAVLVHMVMELFGEPLSPADRQILLDTLLSIRYEFSAQLAAGELSNAFVRGQFIQAWQQVGPVLRNHLGDDPARSVVGYLAFFTAADALAALDRMGPAVGIEISRDGFLRLARLISDQPLDHLEHPGALNPRLREILGLERGPQPAGPGGPGKPHTPPQNPDRPQSWRQPSGQAAFWALVLPGRRAWAQSSVTSTISNLRQWTAEVDPGPTFIARVARVLKDASRRAGQKKNYSAGRQKWFDAMVLATAWQESCFRQFRIRKGKIVYLLSYNRTSVGVMQINERVWSGLYDRHKLRWDIHYNAAAGCEILALYLQRYILKRGAATLEAAKGDGAYLAGWLYALYNGGPRQLARYPQRRSRDKLYQSDRLILAKYRKVTGPGDWVARVDCLPPG